MSDSERTKTTVIRSTQCQRVSNLACSELGDFVMTGRMKPLFAVLLVVFAALLICAVPLNADPTPKPKPKVTAASQLPFGIPVPGKPNLVYSPYAKGKIIDVSIYKHGETVLCPYTAKKFRVP